MKVVLAGAFGKLGSDVLKALVRKGYQVIAADMAEKEIPEIAGKYTFRAIDVTKPETLAGLCTGADIVITTVGLTGVSAAVTNYDIDYQGNLNLLQEAKRAGVKRFTYISVIKADSDEKVPMLHAKAMFEQALKSSGIPYVIHRPTGYFYDIAKVFMPMIRKGQVTLLGKKAACCNVIDTGDFADFIVLHMEDENKTFDVGGKETYSYEQIARMFFAQTGKEAVIKRAPPFLFDVLALANRRKKNGKEAILRFSKWTLTHDLVGKDVYGDKSFRAYIESYVKEAVQ